MRTAARRPPATATVRAGAARLRMRRGAMARGQPSRCCAARTRRAVPHSARATTAVSCGVRVEARPSGRSGYRAEGDVWLVPSYRARRFQLGPRRATAAAEASAPAVAAAAAAPSVNLSRARSAATQSSYERMVAAHAPTAYPWRCRQAWMSHACLPHARSAASRPSASAARCVMGGDALRARCRVKQW